MKSENLSEAVLEKLMIDMWSIPGPPITLAPGLLIVPKKLRRKAWLIMNPALQPKAVLRYLQKRGARPRGKSI